MFKKIFLWSIFIFSLSFSTSDVNISGVVLESRTKKPVADAKVTLLGLKINTVTDSSGKFIISGTQVLFLGNSQTKKTFTSNGLLYVLEKKSPTFIRIFDLSGQMIKTVFSGVLEEGVWEFIPPPLSAGIYLCVFTNGKSSTTFSFIASENKTKSTLRKIKDISYVSNYSTSSSKNAEVSFVDSLQVTKRGYRSVIVPIETYQKRDLNILLEDSSTSNLDDVTIIPDSSWACFMPEGIPPPQVGESVFKIIMEYSEIHNVGKTKFGYRRQIDISGGTITGSKINGTILNGGLDYELTLSNGSMEIEQIAILRCGSTYILMRNAGVAPPEAKYARVVLDFEAPNSSSYTWLHNGKYVANRIIDTGSKKITLDVYDVSKVSLTENKVKIKDPEGVPNQTWECLKLSGSQGNSVFTENVTLGSSISIGASKRGSRNIIPITGGTTSGKVKGKILSGGADYQLSGGLDARYTILTDDGEFIIIRNCGSGTLIPVFEARSDGPYAFLNENKYISSAPGMGSGGVTITFYERK